MPLKTVTPYVLFAMLAASLYSAAVTAADADDGPRQRTVKFADLNLTRNSGIAVLYARIKAAARAVCEQNSELGLSAVHVERECRVRAMSGAIGTINLPMLTSYHREQSGMSNDQFWRLAGTSLEPSK
jgi:UrcA family protein